MNRPIETSSIDTLQLRINPNAVQKGKGSFHDVTVIINGKEMLPDTQYIARRCKLKSGPFPLNEGEFCRTKGKFYGQNAKMENVSIKWAKKSSGQFGDFFTKLDDARHEAEKALNDNAPKGVEFIVKSTFKTTYGSPLHQCDESKKAAYLAAKDWVFQTKFRFSKATGDEPMGSGKLKWTKVKEYVDRNGRTTTQLVKVTTGNVHTIFRHGTVIDNVFRVSGFWAKVEGNDNGTVTKTLTFSVSIDKMFIWPSADDDDSWIEENIDPELKALLSSKKSEEVEDAIDEYDQYEESDMPRPENSEDLESQLAAIRNQAQ